MDRIKLTVLGISYSMSQVGAYALILADELDLHRVPIVIGMSEAQSVVVQLEKIKTQRPLTHDLFKNFMDKMDVVLKEVFIYQLHAGIFYADMLFDNKGTALNIDARTSDAIAVALRCNAPIYTTQEILEKAGVLVNKNGDLSDQRNREISIEDIYNEYTLNELGKLLEEAISNEEYEKAAKIKSILDNRDKKYLK